jgi:hypothetical protein
VSAELDKHDLDSNLENRPGPEGSLIMRTQPHSEASHSLPRPLGPDHLQSSRITKADPDAQRDKSLSDSHYVDQLFVHFSWH